MKASTIHPELDKSPPNVFHHTTSAHECRSVWMTSDVTRLAARREELETHPSPCSLSAFTLAAYLLITDSSWPNERLPSRVGIRYTVAI